MSIFNTNEILSFYEKTKKDWNVNSSVRVKDYSYDLNFQEIDDKQELNFYNSSYCTILEHKKLKNLSLEEKKYVMALQLLEFVEKTTIFEIEHVNKVAQDIALGKYNLKIPNILKLDALKIYTDEGYHAHISKKMTDDLREFYQLDEDINPILENYFNKLKNIGSKFDKKYSYLSNLASVFVSESCTVQDMSNEMKGVVYEPVRKMFGDHMKDEIFHSHFFSTLFRIIWPQLSLKEKEIMGLCLFEAIVIFGKPRTDIYYLALSKLGYDKKFIEVCINDVFGIEDVNVKRIKSKMSQLIKLFEKSGVYENEKVKAKFLEHSLI